MESTPSSQSSSRQLARDDSSSALLVNKATTKNKKDAFAPTTSSTGITSSITKSNGDRDGGDEERDDLSSDDKNENRDTDSRSNATCTKNPTRHVSITTTSDQSEHVDVSVYANAITQNKQLSAQVERLSTQLVEANNEIINLRSRHDVILRQSQNTESEFRRAVIRFETLLNEANTKLDTKDSSIRVLEKVIDALRGKVEQQQRDLNGRSGGGGGRRRSSSRSDVRDSSSVGALATKTRSSAKKEDNGSGHANTGFSSMLSPFKSPTFKPVGSSSPFAVARSPDRTPPRNSRATTHSGAAVVASEQTPPRSSSRRNKTSGSFYRTPPSGKSSTSVKAMNLAPVHLTPSSKAAFLLQEQKKTIESLTCTLIGERDRNAVLEREAEELRRTLNKYTSGSILCLSPSLVKEEEGFGNVDGEGASCNNSDSGRCLDSCNSDDFDYYGEEDAPCSDIGRPAGFDLDASQGGDVDEDFIRKLDELGIDLSTEIANLSTVCGGDNN